MPSPDANLTGDHVDVVIVGAGLSGIGAAHHLQDKCPDLSYTILESRDSIGGTWDLFRYPGVRSDSDMLTLGYRLRPWAGSAAVAGGDSILQYVRDTAREQGIDRRIRFGRRVVRAEWSSAASRWTLQIRQGADIVEMTCGFLYCCSGYYRYDKGFQPEWPGLGSFTGRVVHPQDWPADLDHTGKQVVVIGSGATAMTLVPAMASTAAGVTMVQRSPTYVISLPAEDAFNDRLRRILPAGPAFLLSRWKNVLTSIVGYQITRRWPEAAKKFLIRGVERQLPPGFDVGTHFTPRYNPWDQRLCVVPDGDLFRCLSDGTATVVTDQMVEFVPHGVRLASGTVLDADIVVTATGLDLLAFGGMQLSVDGRDVDLPTSMAYRSLMLAGVPNFAFAIGYTNASWTLKVDLTSAYVCRLLNLMRKKHYAAAVPVADPSVQGVQFLDFAANYVRRSVQDFPQQGSVAPWRVTMNYLRDLPALRFGSITQRMEFRPVRPPIDRPVGRRSRVVPHQTSSTDSEDAIRAVDVTCPRSGSVEQAAAAPAAVQARRPGEGIA